MPTRQQMQQTVLERLFWNTAERDDAKVADYLFRRREMDSVFTLDEATLFDFFFHYLREIKVFSLLARLYRAFCVNGCPINENWGFFV
ncbi:hypothetical protein DSTSK_00010 [Desulforhabdus sp. TSK]|nr:hypothetical protein DSTSK_00010 [Desulforhabdus sp. TSK]